MSVRFLKCICFGGIIFLIINFIALNLISMHLELDSITGVILTIASKDISNISPVTKIWSIKFLSFLLGNFIFSVLFSILIYRLSKIKITVSSVLGASGFAAFSGYIYFYLVEYCQFFCLQMIVLLVI